MAKGFVRYQLRMLVGISWLIVLEGIAGCGPTLKEWEPDTKSTRIYTVAFRQLPPEPVYNRLRWVHLPEPLPPRELSASASPNLEPVFSVQLRNVTLEEAAKALAQAAHYDSFCLSSIAKQRVTLNSLGTLPELAEQLGEKAGVHVTIDPWSRQIRFLTRANELGGPASPRFLDAANARSADKVAMEAIGK